MNNVHINPSNFGIDNRITFGSAKKKIVKSAVSAIEFEGKKLVENPLAVLSCTAATIAGATKVLIDNAVDKKQSILSVNDTVAVSLDLAHAMNDLKKNYSTSEIILKVNGVEEEFTCYENSQIGSNPAFWAINKRTGELLYIKYPFSNEDLGHIESEFLANKLYNLAGVKTPDVKLVYMRDGRICFASKFQEGLKHLEKAEAQKAFAVDAWLANWDGVYPGNTMSVDGNCVKLDCGGALKYRAMGELKQDFHDEVKELITLLSPQNYESFSVYGDMSRDVAIKSMEKIVKISDKSIIQLVEDKNLAQILINRKKYIANFLKELKNLPKSNNTLSDDFHIVAIKLKNEVSNVSLTKEGVVELFKKCIKNFEMFPSSNYLSDFLIKQIKAIEKQGINFTKEDLINFLTEMSQEKFVFPNITKEQRSIYQKLFIRLKELVEKTPMEEGESLSKYFSRIEKVRKKRVKQLEDGRKSFIKSRLQYDNKVEEIIPTHLTEEQKQKSIKELEDIRISMEKLEILLLPKLGKNATEEEIFSSWLIAHVAGESFGDDALEETVMSLGERYNSSLKQVRQSRFENIMENDYRQDFKYEPVYRWLEIKDSEKFINEFPKRGEIYSAPGKQCCSTNKYYAEIDFNDDSNIMNVKFVIHPKAEASRAYLLGTDNEVVYPQSQKFRVIDKDFVEYINPKTKMGCARYEVHLQEI